MSCGAATCQSGCYKADGELATGKKEPSDVILTNIGTNRNHFNICVKCKTNEATIANAGGGGGGDDGGRFCVDCFRGNLFGKFKLAVTSNAMISPTDNVLVAFSGGPSSRVALQFVHEMQHKAQKNFDASPDRSLPVFGVGVAFVDETTIHPVPSQEFDKSIEGMKQIVSLLGPPRNILHVVPIERICSSEPSEGKDRLKELLSSVSDATGKEDLLTHLRMSLLQKIALENGYTKLVLGSCTSRISCHVLAATVKGQGYSLAADIQYVDARREIPVVLPLRDCLMQELNTLCTLDSLKTVEFFNGPRAGINGLISSFVKLLQEENASRECTIVRTAGKLTPFHFNKMPEADNPNVHLATQRRQKKYNIKQNESLPPESFCPICSSPLRNSNYGGSSGVENGQMTTGIFRAMCCSSCQFQILPKESYSMEHFYSVLPQQIVSRGNDGSLCNQRWLREQIQDCLLSDNEEALLMNHFDHNN